jgi:DNA mismatch repair protein MutS
LAGVPRIVNERAKAILAQLEIDHLNKYGESKIAPRPRNSESPIQLTLFEWTEHPLLEKIRSLDTTRTTPIEALQVIEQWQRELKS